ncbi:MAG: hypothetical protein GKR93_14560 [Gammaproteobacteria bacterium]|nr:hypothetical protein [Gammaproteobacteria bacterium]
MDKTYIEEHDIGGKYLRGELVPEESSAFEEYLMEDGDMLEQLELDSVIFKHSTRAFEEINKKQKNKKWRGFFQIASGMAAGALLMTLISPLFLTEKDMFDSYGIAQIEYFDELRNIDSETVQTRNILLESETQRLILSIDTGEISDSLYDVIISSESGRNESRISIKNISGSETGELIIDIPVEVISEDIYALNIYRSGTRVLSKGYILNFDSNK